MSMVKWDAVCIFCGRKCGGMSRSETQGTPTTNPPNTSSKCPSSPDGRHKPRWERA